LFGKFRFVHCWLQHTAGASRRDCKPLIFLCKLCVTVI
jgi:hypothetical protein